MRMEDMGTQQWPLRDPRVDLPHVPFTFIPCAEEDAKGIAHQRELHLIVEVRPVDRIALFADPFGAVPVGLLLEAKGEPLRRTPVCDLHETYLPGVDSAADEGRTIIDTGEEVSRTFRPDDLSIPQHADFGNWASVLIAGKAPGETRFGPPEAKSLAGALAPRRDNGQVSIRGSGQSQHHERRKQDS